MTFPQSAKEKIYCGLRATGLGQEAILQAKEKLAEGPYLPFLLQCRCWWGQTSCGSGQRGGVGKYNTCSRSSCCSCTSEWVGKGKAHHAALHTEQVPGRLCLDIVIWQSAVLLPLFACGNQTPLIRRVAPLILDFSFDIVSGVTRLDLNDDGPVRVFTEIWISASAAWLPVEEKGRSNIHPTNCKQ